MNQDRPYDAERRIASIEWKPPAQDTFSDLTDALKSGVCRVAFSSSDAETTISNATIHLAPKPECASVRQRMRKIKAEGAIPRVRMRFDGADAFTPELPAWTLFQGTTSNFDRVAYKVLVSQDKLAPFF